MLLTELDCGEDWVTGNGSCYYMVSRSLSQDDARDYCWEEVSHKLLILLSSAYSNTDFINNPSSISATKSIDKNIKS